MTKNYLNLKKIGSEKSDAYVRLNAGKGLNSFMPLVAFLKLNYELNFFLGIIEIKPILTKS